MQPLRGRWTYNKLHITLFERLPFWDHVGATGNAQSCISHYFGGFRFGTAWGPIETHTAAYHTISEASVLGPLRGQWTRTQLHMHYFGGFRFGTAWGPIETHTAAYHTISEASVLGPLRGQWTRTQLHIALFEELPFWDRIWADERAQNCIFEGLPFWDRLGADGHAQK